MAESTWMVRAGSNNELIEPFVTRSLVAVGWEELGDVSDLQTRSELRAHFASREAYVDYKDGRITTNASQVFRFAHEIDTGDWVLTYDKDEREYHVGTVTGGYEYNPSDAPEGYPHVRRVEWKEVLSRDSFSTPAKNTLGGALTIFSLNDYQDEIHQQLSDTSAKPSTAREVDEGDDEPPFADTVETQAEGLISDFIANMDPYDFEGLVAAVLRAMGYNATKTRDSHDRGVDVIAHPDSLGFEEPYIKVQVKRTSSTVGGPEMRSFTGTLNDDEMGLYVSTGGYTPDAKEAKRTADVRITLLDRDEFIDLLLQHYESIESEYKAKIPLKRIYIPTEDPPIEE